MLLERLSQQSGVSQPRLKFIQQKASVMYKTYPIPKRNGKDRIISQPTPELKAIQRWVVRSVLNRLPVSKYATAYQKGSSIRKNAKAHAGSSFTLHMDFSDFFPSFSSQNVSEFLSAATELTTQDIEFCTAIVSRRGALTIGAPSSPAVTNALMYSFDVEVAKWCAAQGLVYTRYADDINISSFGPGKLSDVEHFIRGVSARFTYGNLRINEEKTAHLSRKYRRSITGVNLTPEGGLSIGRARKREIKHFVHLFKSGLLAEDLRWRIGGLIAFASDVEPNFVLSLKKKYGSEVIEELLHQNTPHNLRVF